MANSDASWAGDRELCPCCGYPTDVDEEALGCGMCDWREPETDTSILGNFQYRLVPQPVEIDVSSPERDRLLEVARRNYAAFGSSLTPAERSEQLGELSERAVELCRQLRQRYDEMRRAGRPATAAAWDETDALMAELRLALIPEV